MASQQQCTLESKGLVFLRDGTVDPADPVTLEYMGTGRMRFVGTIPPRLSNIAEPVAPDDAATKSYVDAHSGGGGFNLLTDIAFAAVEPQTLAMLVIGYTTEGVTLTDTMRFLLTAQAGGIENGIYTVQPGGAPPLRSFDMLDGSFAGLAFMFSTAGDRSSETAWLCSTPPGDSEVGTDPLTFLISAGEQPVLLAPTQSGLELGGTYSDELAVRTDGVTIEVSAGTGLLEIKDGGVDTTQLADDAVDTLQLADAAVTKDKIATDAVTTDKIFNKNVTGGKIADATITITQMGVASVGANQLTADAVTETKIADATVTTDKIADDAVTTDKILNKNVTGGKIADATITITQMGAASVGAAQLTTDAVIAAKIAADAVTTVKILNKNVTGGKIADATITVTQMGTASVGETQLTTDAVTTNKIANANVTNAKLANSSFGVTTDANLTGAATVSLGGTLALGLGTGVALTSATGGAVGQVAYFTNTNNRTVANSTKVVLSESGAPGSGFDNVTTTGVVSAGQLLSLSDVRFKTNIQHYPTQRAADAVRALRPCTFDWKQDNGPAGEQMGFIAQEVREVLPSAVKGNSERYVLHEGALICALMGAVQQLQVRVDALEAAALGHPADPPANY